MSIPRRRRVLTALALTGALTAAAVPAFADKGAGDPGSDKSDMERAERVAAVATLERAEALLDGTSSEDPRGATMALRDVRMLRDSLPADLAARADEVLLRPPDEGGTWVKTCNTEVCVHHLQGADIGSGEYDVNDVLATVQDIRDKYVAAGYREPLPDGTTGGDAKFDVYLEDLGDQNLYGYCTSDDPKQASPETGWDLWAYCAFDDDFSAAQFPSNTPLENMQVTAAHEYFHATQYAYDAFEDSWILEATATWAEDELYDDVNDNYNYNGSGPIAHPTTPLDSDQNGSLFKYGAWTFFRYLTERFPAAQGGIPTLVRELLESMDGSVGGPDRFSLQAVQEVLGDHGTSLSAAFAGYSLANRAPEAIYEEGADYPTAPAKSVTVSSKSKNPGAYTKTLDHLTSSTVRYRPSNLSASNWKLRLKLDLAPKAKGSAAAVTVVKKNGTRTLLGYAKLNAQGDATVAAPFSSSSVAAVEVTLLNLSGRLNDCWDGDTPYSCYGGNPLDDNLRQSVDPVAYRP
ncbi:hypothetical protein HNR19_001409 [Nocardioides thalensis]|uniref:Uncharacterized protein n=1 Tax=Nocardioides thalensis TaxID=1914755 RepID=A0A853C0J0_9ACTN|nr:MXAN_6640 family putative metalloprotease [Nocardioides thalensis]NYJ00711.1 hypothetical protein [Nocardioides thalensis]